MAKIKLKRTIYWNKWLFIVILIGFGLFYWFQIRPSEIKKECAWHQVPERYQSARPASDRWPDCLNEEYNPNTIEDLNARLEATFGCYGPTPEKREESYYREATDKEYQQCLRENGL